MLSISGDLPDAEDTCEHASLTGRTSDEMLCYQLGLGVPHSLGAFEALWKCFRDNLPRAVYHGTHRRPKVERSRCWLLSGQTQEHQMPRTGDTVWFEAAQSFVEIDRPGAVDARSDFLGEGRVQRVLETQVRF